MTPPSGFDGAAAQVAETRGVTLSTPGAPDALLDIYAPKDPGAQALPIVLWIHGGGFISSSADTVKAYAILLSQQGFVVASLDYSLAPGAQHPVPVEQANTALAYLQNHGADYGADSTTVFLGGDSAGAQIASELAAVETDAATASRVGISPAVAAGNVKGVVLFCGLYDMSTVGATGFPALRTYLWAYTGHRDWMTAPDIDELSTATTATASYPATFISVGDADPFSTQATEFTARLTTLGVPVTSLFWNGTGDGLGHEYQFDFTLPEAQVAFTQTVQFLKSRAGE